MDIADRLEKALIEVVEREATKTNATPEELKALADVALVLARICS